MIWLMTSGKITKTNMQFMTAAEVRAKSQLLILSGQDDDGDLEWLGTDQQHRAAKTLTTTLLND